MHLPMRRPTPNTTRWQRKAFSLAGSWMDLGIFSVAQAHRVQPSHIETDRTCEVLHGSGTMGETVGGCRGLTRRPLVGSEKDAVVAERRSRRKRAGRFFPPA